ncbi:MAG: methyltransferase domain-containing protein [Dehalococcoidales bacterium]|nr:MAG: methyltransferase domain-containing protein [Dehalococcoidales bacterium]
MAQRRKYQTIEHDWPRFFREYPEVYDRFSGHSETTAAIISDMFGLDDKVVLEVGSGTGIATLELAKRARLVIAVEPEETMMRVATKKARENGITNIAFVHGDGTRLPLAGNSVDCTVTVYAGPLSHEEASRVVKKGGFIIRAGNHYRWYGGELAPIIPERNRAIGHGYELDRYLRNECSYSYKDLWVTHTYPTLEEAIETYGFIFGSEAIDYLVANDKKSIRHKLRIFYREI